MLFILNSMHKKTDIKNHPKFIVIFNDVSLYENVSLDKLDEHLKQARCCEDLQDDRIDLVRPKKMMC